VWSDSIQTLLTGSLALGELVMDPISDLRMYMAHKLGLPQRGYLPVRASLACLLQSLLMIPSGLWGLWSYKSLDDLPYPTRATWLYQEVQSQYSMFELLTL
jgi:hypothetical protein